MILLPNEGREIYFCVRLWKSKVSYDFALRKVSGLFLYKLDVRRNNTQ